MLYNPVTNIFTPLFREITKRTLDVILVGTILTTSYLVINHIITPNPSPLEEGVQKIQSKPASVKSNDYENITATRQ